MTVRQPITPLQGTGVLRVGGAVLNNSEIISLPTTPLEIIPTPGPGKALFAFSAIGVLDVTHGAYSNVDADSASGPQLKSGTLLTLLPSFAGWQFEDDSELWFMTFLPQISGADSSLLAGVSDSLAAIENQPISMNFNNLSSGNLQDGNAQNTLSCTVFYAVVDL